MTAAALVKYFQPLTDWLKEQNGDVDVTWDEECPSGSFMESPPEGSGKERFSFSLALIFLALFLGKLL